MKRIQDNAGSLMARKHEPATRSGFRSTRQMQEVRRRALRGIRARFAIAGLQFDLTKLPDDIDFLTPHKP